MEEFTHLCVRKHELMFANIVHYKTTEKHTPKIDIKRQILSSLEICLWKYIHNNAMNSVV
jgi:hypothetical protein